MSLRILFLVPHVPASPRAPGSPRPFALMRGLHARGHSLALVCGVEERARWEQFMGADGGAEFLAAQFPLFAKPQLSAHGRARNLLSSRPAFDMKYRAPAYHKQMRALVERARVEFPSDLIHVDQLAMAQYIPEAWRGALVVDPNDAISLTEARKLTLGRMNAAQRVLHRYQIAKIKRYEADIAARADAYVVNARPDLEYLAAFIPRAKLCAIPNDVDTVYFHPARETATKAELVFTGSFDYAFNADAMLYFHARILPRVRAVFPALRLQIVGANPPPALHALAACDALTTVTGLVDDVRPYVWQAAVYISPLRGGTGMKNKLLNAMAMGKAIVATPASADGLGARHEQELLLAEGDAEFADAVIRVLNDTVLAQRLGNTARAFVESEYSYPKLAMQFEELYLSIVR